MPNIEWYPGIIIVAGIFRYLYIRFFSVPPSQATLDDLDEKMFLGGFQYTTGSAIAIIVVGLIFFICANLAFFQWLFK